MININELIQDYMDEGRSKEDVLLLAKAELKKRRINRIASDKEAAAKSIKEHGARAF